MLFKKYLASTLVLSALLVGTGACSSNQADTSAPASGWSEQPQEDENALHISLVQIGDMVGSEKVRSECALQTRLPEFIAANIEEPVVLVNRVLEPDEAKRVLNIEIIELTGMGGGAWTGPKGVIVEGTLYEDGQSVGNFKGRRTTTGGAFAMFKGTCSFYGRCVKSLGRDIGEFLAEPQQGMRIGGW